jgi:hypothetical protein
MLDDRLVLVFAFNSASGSSTILTMTISPIFLALLSGNRLIPEASDHKDPFAGKGGV